MCRSRRELSNAYLLAKIGVDTAENEPLEVWGENSIQYSLHSLGKTQAVLTMLAAAGDEAAVAVLDPGLPAESGGGEPFQVADEPSRESEADRLPE